MFSQILRWNRTVRLFPALFLTVLLAGACADDPAAPQTLDADALALQEILHEAIVDEFRAEAIYDRVIQDFGPVLPFANIVQAEVRHSDALAQVLANRGWAVPDNPWSPAAAPAFASVPLACAAGVTAEVDNAAIYDQYLGLDLPADVLQVFQSNRDASQLAHLPAFERCS